MFGRRKRDPDESRACLPELQKAGRAIATLAQILPLARRSYSGFQIIFLAELVYPPRGIQQLLLAGIKRVANGTNFNMDLPTRSGARSKAITATARHHDFTVFGMNILLHNFLLADQKSLLKLTLEFYRAGSFATSPKFFSH